MLEDEMMHDQVGQNEFENLDEDQIMQKNDLDYSSEWDRSTYPREKKKTGGERQREQRNPKNKTITRRITRPTRV